MYFIRAIDFTNLAKKHELCVRENHRRKVYLVLRDPSHNLTKDGSDDHNDNDVL